MKKLTLTLAVISALALTACASGEESQQTEGTTATAAVTTKAPDEPDCVLYEDNCYFTYPQLTNAMKEQYSEEELLPLPDVIYTWEFTLGQIEEYYYGMGPCYILDFDDTANNTHIRVTVLFDAVYTDIDGFIQQLPKAYSDNEYTVVNDGYAYAHDVSGGYTTVMGITSDRNIVYMLSVKTDGKYTDSTDVLDEYNAKLEL